MDPATIVGLVSSAAALAKICGSAAKDLNTLVSKYKNAKLAILSMIQGLDTMQLAWSRIEQWVQNETPDELLEKDDFIGRLQRSLETGSLVMDALKEELLVYKPLKMGLTQRTKVVWNEGTLKSHQERIRDQASSMTLLLQAVQLPTSRDRNDLLRKSEKQFEKSDESAYSIVPSRMSMSIYTGHTTDSGASKNEDDLIYKPLTFEDELFTARVYKRNYRTPALRRLFKRTEQKTSDKTRVCTMAQENVEDPNRSEAERCTIREPRPARWQHTKAQNAGPSISFADACEQGDAEIVRIFLQSGQDVHVPILGRSHSFLDLSAIHIAAKGGHVQVVEILLSYGAHREMLSQCSLIRPLHLAVQAGHIVMVRYLLDNGTNIAAPDGDSAQAIHKAAECGSTAILSFLLDRGAAIDSATTNGCQPLHKASQRPGRANVIRFLCSQGADIEAKTLLGYTPLYCAWLYNRLDNAEVLLEFGAVHGEQVPFILSTAIGHGHLQATRWLLERGVDPNRPDYDQRTALHGLFNDYTVLYFDRYHSPQSAEIVELLLEYGADVDLQDWNGDTPLHCLCRRSLHQNEYPELHMVNILLRSMRDIDTINFAGETALCLSIQRRIGNDVTESLTDCGTRLLLSQLLIGSGARLLLSQLLIGSGARLLLSKPGIEIGLTLDESSNEHLFILDYYLRRGSNTLTKRLGKYEKDDSIVRLDNLSIDVLRRMLRARNLV